VQDNCLTNVRPISRIVVFCLVAALILSADQVTKYLIVRHIPVNSGFELINGLVNLVHVRNSGAAFGFLSERGAGPFFIVISVAVLVGISWILAKSAELSPLLLVGYGCFFGGALGNLADRLRLGEVVDFVDVHWGNLHWPAFNVADSALTVAVGILLIEFVLHHEARDKQASWIAAPKE
jgi:signal peptidase II